MSEDNQPDAETCSIWIKALSDPHRLRIVQSLALQPQTVTCLAECLKVTVSLASHHLQILRHAGLVVVTRRGKFSSYQLNPEFFRSGNLETQACMEFGCCQFRLPVSRPARETVPDECNRDQ